MERPDQCMGPPPPSRAQANRMNAAGISVFYGATDPGVSLAEIRPPVGSKVLIGCFEVTRPLRLLDFVALSDLSHEKGSRFDREYVHRLKRAEFLRRLGERISKPVMPGTQILDYLPTQAMADFLSTATDPPLDGILYPSAQEPDQRRVRRIFGGGEYKRNVILFQKEARVQRLDEGAEISVSDDSPFSFGEYFGEYFDEAPDLKYSVEVGSAAPSRAPDDAPLRLLTLEVHYVKGVKFDTRSSRVDRYYQTEERETESREGTA